MKRNQIRLAARAVGLVLAGSAALVATGVGAQASGISGPAFYVDHELYRTVATPAQLDGTGAPDSTYDTIYNFFGVQTNVADAAPGTPGYNGGRWMVHKVALTGTYAAALAAGDHDHDGVLDSAGEVRAALDAGALSDEGVIAAFVCTVNKLPAGSA
jgi:hypothetical protein